mgnify:CR=1 FL=1
MEKYEIMLEELKYVLKDKINEYLDINKKYSNDDIEIAFNKYANKNKQKIKIKELIDNYQDKSFFLNTPDGYQEVGEFYIKNNKDIYKIETVDKFKTKCSGDHKFETSLGWKFAKDITKKDLLLTKAGYRKVSNITKYKKKEETYDFEVLHNNHRYWSGNGISSHNTGKTYLAMSICRKAQQMGYNIIYCDSEGAMDPEFARRLGVDPSRVLVQPVSTIEEFSNFAANITKYLKEEKDAGRPQKVVIVLDSLGNLSSEKERTDVLEGNAKRDMTKQQHIRAAFRVNGNMFTKLGIPFIICAHVYEKVGSYVPGKEVSGGGGIKYNASIILQLTKSKLDDKESEDKVKKQNIETNKIGIVITITPLKQRFTRPIKVQIHLPFYKAPNPYVGLEKFVSWNGCGIIRGKCLTEKEYNKLSPDDQKLCGEFKGTDGQTLYAFPKDTSRYLVCRHLGGEVPISELFTEKVFTQEVLKELDEKVIKKIFMLPSIESLEDLAELSTELGGEEDGELIAKEVEIEGLE